MAAATFCSVATALDRVGPYGLGLALADDVLALAELSPRDRAGVRSSAGALELSVGRLERGEAHLDAGLALAREGGSAKFEGRILTRRAILRSMQGRTEEATADYRLALARGDPGPDEAVALSNLGALLVGSDPEEAERLLTAALAIQRQTGDRVGESFTLGNLGLLELGWQNLAAAEQWYREALAVAREMGIGGPKRSWSSASAMSSAGWGGTTQPAPASPSRTPSIGSWGTGGAKPRPWSGSPSSVPRIGDRGAGARLDAALAIYRELGDTRSVADVLERSRALDTKL